MQPIRRITALMGVSLLLLGCAGAKPKTAVPQRDLVAPVAGARYFGSSDLTLNRCGNLPAQWDTTKPPISIASLGGAVTSGGQIGPVKISWDVGRVAQALAGSQCVCGDRRVVSIACRAQLANDAEPIELHFRFDGGGFLYAVGGYATGTQSQDSFTPRAWRAQATRWVTSLAQTKDSSLFVPYYNTYETLDLSSGTLTVKKFSTASKPSDVEIDFLGRLKKITDAMLTPGRAEGNTAQQTLEAESQSGGGMVYLAVECPLNALPHWTLSSREFRPILPRP